jgi:hypothetical protein
MKVDLTSSTVQCVIQGNLRPYPSAMVTYVWLRINYFHTSFKAIFILHQHLHLVFTLHTGGMCSLYKTLYGYSNALRAKVKTSPGTQVIHINIPSSASLTLHQPWTLSS